MIRRITLENFMSHGRTVLELADGLTVLIGENNCGKSAVVEALRTLCENDNADHLIRHGASECAIIVETDDGHSIAWRRKGTAVSYEVDGVERGRLKGSVPENLHELLRLPKVMTGKDEFIDVHFGLQKSPVFLLHENASERKAAAFFSSASDAEKLMQMQQRHREKVRNAKLRQRDHVRELARCDALLQTLAPMAEIEPRLVELEVAYEAIQAESKQIREVESLLLEIAGRLDEVADRGDRVKALSQIADPPELEDERAVSAVIEGIAEYQWRLDSAGSWLAVLEPLIATPAQEETTSLSSLIEQIEHQAREGRRHQAAQSTLSLLTELAPALDPTPLQSFVGELAAAEEALTRLTVELGQQKDAVSELASEIRAYAADNPQCPVCGGAIDAEQLFGQEHAHAE